MSTSVSEKAAQAFWAGKSFRRSGHGATEVYERGGYVYLVLHGSEIARRKVDYAPGPGIFEVRHCGWPTVTTRDRLTALFEKFHQPIGHCRGNRAVGAEFFTLCGIKWPMFPGERRFFGWIPVHRRLTHEAASYRRFKRTHPHLFR